MGALRMITDFEDETPKGVATLVWEKYKSGLIPEDDFHLLVTGLASRSTGKSVTKPGRAWMQDFLVELYLFARNEEFPRLLLIEAIKIAEAA